MVTKLKHFLGYTLYAVVYSGILVGIIWLGIKFDLAEKPYTPDGTPNYEFYQETGSR